MKRNYNPRLSARRTRKPNWPPGVITGEEDIQEKVELVVDGS